MTSTSNNKMSPEIPALTSKKWSWMPPALRRPLSFVRSLVERQKALALRRFRDAVVGNFVVPVIYRRRLNSYRAAAPYFPADHLPRFLYLRPKYISGTGTMRKDELCPVFEDQGPLRSSKVAEVDEYFYDLDYSGGILGDKKLIDKIIEYRPDLLILSGYSHKNPKMPSSRALRAIRHDVGIPIMREWGDSMGYKSVEDCYHLMDTVDLNVVRDSDNLIRHFAGNPKFLRMWSPYDFSLFRPGNGQRDLNVSFLGYNEGYRSGRVAYLDYLQEHQPGVYFGGGRGEGRLDEETLADILRRSKIGINFSFSIPGTDQLKGRVFQVIYSGALLMENENEETPRLFTPMVDYVVFDSKEDLLDKCRYYLDHDEERQEIAFNGYIKATSEYNYQVYWDTILSTLKESELIPG